MRIIFCFRYTERFDKVQLNKVVEDMSELSVPEVVDLTFVYKCFEFFFICMLN